MKKKLKEDKMSKIYNFGGLGKWTKDTLLIQKEWDWGNDRWKIKTIEQHHNSLAHDINKDIKWYRTKRCWFRSIGEIYRLFKRIKTLEESFDKLDSNYNNYLSVMKKLKKRK